MKPGQTIPRATYRLQFNRHFGLRQALECVPYLSELGVSHLYASPLLMARPGSTHGYDVCQPARLNPEIGTEAELETLVAALRARGMGLVLDIVPNHQGVGGPENPWWWDVLKHGRQSQFAHHFDIDWDLPDPGRRGKVLLPVLASDLAQALERRELELAREEGELVLRYFDHRFPLNPAALVESGLSTANAPAAVRDDASALERLLNRQHYELIGWREGDRRLNYRRFFTIADLAGLRVELPRVFDDTHQLILDWHRRGLLDGLRIDHPDGLRDPQAYLERLSQSAPGAWIVVEKILMTEEQLPQKWPVAGTTGYDFLGRVNAWLVDPEGERPLTEFYGEFTGEPVDYAALVREKKRWILRERLATEVSRLVRISSWLANRDGRGPVLTEGQLREATIELAACFPVYRTYLCAETDEDLEPSEPATPGESAHEVDLAMVRTAVDLARRERPDLEAAIEFLRGLLVGRARGGGTADWVMRFQQLTGPAMAKGVEDTAYYCYNRCIALNEVGGDPSRFGLSAGGFHRACVEASLHWPHGMLTTSTHDTKRGEDVRARLALLSEIPRRWATAVRQWSAMNEAHRTHGWPDRNAEYFFYQTLVGAWPLSVDRALACMEKAVREAAQHTNWIQRHDEYENALRHFLKRTLADSGFLKAVEQFLAPLLGAGYLGALAQTVLKLTTPGVPDLYQGTEFWDLNLVDPDNRRPVDFARRREALEEMRQRMEADGLSALLSEWLRSPADGRIKLFVIHRILVFRRERERLFREGRYVPLVAAGSRSEQVCAFARELGAVKAVIVVPQRVLSLAEGCGGQTLGEAVWGETAVILPRVWAGQVFRNVFTEERVVARQEGGLVSLHLAELFARFPVALCESFVPSVSSRSIKGE